MYTIKAQGIVETVHLQTSFQQKLSPKERKSASFGKGENKATWWTAFWPMMQTNNAVGRGRRILGDSNRAVWWVLRQSSAGAGFSSFHVMHSVYKVNKEYTYRMREPPLKMKAWKWPAKWPAFFIKEIFHSITFSWCISSFQSTKVYRAWDPNQSRLHQSFEKSTWVCVTRNDSKSF